MKRCFVVCAVLACGAASVYAEAVFENLGHAARAKATSFAFATDGADGSRIAWVQYEGVDGLDLLGARADTGEIIRVSLARWGRSHIQMRPGEDGNIYAYSGNPAHFFRYDPRTGELTDLGCPAEPAHYFLGHTADKDGWFYVGSYPATHLVRCNTRTGEVQSLGRIADDERQMYIIHPAVSDAGIVYCPVGLHHRELWAYDTNSDTKTQILPDSLTQAQGCPEVWRAADGQVYGSSGRTRFLCKPDGIDTAVEVLPAAREPRDRSAGEKLVFVEINSEGKLVLENAETEEKTYIATTYTGRPLKIYCVGPERAGKVWGGTISPAITFSYDVAASEFTEHGRLSAGGIQVYDIEHPPAGSGLSGLFFGSYTGAYMEYYDPDRPREAGVNPFTFEQADMQERPIQWCHGPDDRMYVGTIPVKGHLGGALVRIDTTGGAPAQMEVKSWRNIVPDQSILYCCAIPQTGDLLCASSVQGGTSAKPTQEEAVVALWDCAQEKVSFTFKPVPGTTAYGRALCASTGIIYGLAGNSYYAFDAVKRETVMTGELPGKAVHFPGLADCPVGEKGLIYGLADDVVFAIDPADHSVRVVARHESLKSAFGFYVTKDAVLYYGSGSELWRCELSKADQ